ncbi:MULTISPECIES: VOC family protein [Oceanobacillus]|uniref:VOC family protein n=1 Tax=Oceanobacillus aidingensis TaxID=645964 RepID=A0ABV9JSE6_9BACI|nr:VOC family protein [Oceanobacillus oncorhynchi]UUI39917.1 VOC family protein [Oceanobacillus oncorhynchi]
MMGRITGFIHSGITVRSLSESLNFYVDLLGLELLSTQTVTADYVFKIVEIPGLEKVEIAFVKIPGGNEIEILEYGGPKTYPGNARSCDYGTGHICLKVDDLESIYKDFKEKGVQFQSKGVVDITSGANKGAKALYMLDPDGYIIELMENL